MSTYTVRTTVPVYVEIAVADDGTADVFRVIVADDEIAATLDEALTPGGTVTDENGLRVRKWYFGGRAEHDTSPLYQRPVIDEPDWPAIAQAYDRSQWPHWEFGW